MKATFRSSLLLLIASATFFTSCKKDEVQAVLAPSGSVTLASTATTLVLLQANAAAAASSFTWDKAKFGYAAGITYTLEFSKGGTNFATATSTTINMATALSKGFTVGEFNAKMQDIIPYGSAQQVQARIKADVGSGVAPIYSNVLALTVTSYRDIVNYNFPQALWIAGNFQGWSPSTAPKIVDKFASGTTGSGYDGYINFTNATPEFKIVKGPDWSFGDFGASSSTVLTNGGSNLTLSNGAGVYRLTASTSGMTWSATKITTWGIIGSATPGDWGASTPMTFNAADGTWTITVNLTGGAGKEMKFRANNDWGINFGDNNPADNKPEYGGDNIKIAATGNYTITLDIGIAGNYSYTIRRN
ncbi:MAG: SusE domain-containing protein [Bacteroidota bacterium]|nr:SusE domain-containing protein [Bacteroidota bacterium]